MNRKTGYLLLAAIIIFSLLSSSEKNSNVYGFSAESIEGSEINLGSFRGKVLLIVNVASKCGYTPQYEGLQDLYERFNPEGLVVLGFPANNFRNQEPGSDEEIKAFCRANYGVTFPMFSKISVIGENIHPLYGYLTDKNEHPEFGGDVSWNFNKFLISRSGRIIARFSSRTKPNEKELLNKVEEELKKD